MTEYFSDVNGATPRRPVLGNVPGGGLALLGVKVMRLRNGLTLIHKEDDRFPNIFFQLEVKAGPAWEKPEEAGASHLVEHLAFGAGDDGADMYERADLLGGNVWANTSRDYTTFFADFPRAQWKEALALLHRLVFQMPLTQEALEVEKEIVLAELREDASREDKVLYDLTLEKLFAGTPYQKSVIGTEESVGGITAEILREYVRRRYQPRDMVFAVVGNVDPDALLEAVDRLFGGFFSEAPMESAPAIPPSAVRKGLSVEVRPMNAFGSSLCMAFPVPFVRPRLAAALTVLAELLDGSDAAFLKRRLCFEAGVAGNVRVSYEAFERAGVFMVEAFVGSRDICACLRTLSACLAGLDDMTFSDEQIRQACSRIADGSVRSLEKAEVIADIISDENLHPIASTSGWMPVPDFRDIGREQIRQALALCLRPDAAAVTVLADETDGAAPDESSARAAVEEGWPGLGKAMPPAFEEKHNAAAPETIILGEGRSLVLLPDASLPFCAASLCFAGGEMLASKTGLHGMDVLARILGLGLEGRNRQETASWLYERSASFHACRGVNDFSLNMTTPKRFAPELFSLMKEAVERPVFHEEDFERERELAGFEEDRMLRYFQLIRHILLKEGPYRNAVWPEAPQSMCFSDMERLWREQASRPWTLCVSGDFDREAVLSFAEGLSLPTGPEVDSMEPEWEEFGPFSCPCEASEQSVYALFFRTSGEKSPDRPAVELLQRCLNGGGGLLYRALRQERQLCYSAEAIDWCEAGAGLMGIFVLTSPDLLDEVEDTLKDVLLRLREEVLTDEELNRSKASALSVVRARMQRIEGRAFETARQVRQGRSLDFAERWMEAVRAVSSVQVREAARKYIVLEDAAELCIEPELEE